MDTATLQHLASWCAHCADGLTTYDAIRTYLDSLTADERAEAIAEGWAASARRVEPEVNPDPWIGERPQRY